VKVKISGYPQWVGPYQIAEKILFWMDKYDEDGGESDRIHKFGTWLAEDRHGNDSWLTKLCAWIHKHLQNGGDRRVSVRIDSTDVYSADSTLALIIAPTLRLLKQNKNGSPMVDNEDVPPELQMTDREVAVNDNGHWDKSLGASDQEQAAASDKFHARWDWILSEMIWAFEQHEAGDWEDQFHSGEHDTRWVDVDVEGNEVGPDYEGEKFHRMERGPNDTHTYDHEGARAYSARMANGRRLFAKYYQSLWW
jgi:hypothetical protein